MNKILTLFEGDGDPFLLQETGNGKISLAFLLEDSPFNYAYYYTASKYFHKPNTINITNYTIKPLNETTTEPPLHTQFEYFILFYNNPKLATKFIQETSKTTGTPLQPDMLDYYILSETGCMANSEVTLLSNYNFTTINNKPLLKIIDFYKNTEKTINKIINGEEHKAHPNQINTLQTYPIDYTVIDNTLYEFNYYTGKLKEIDTIKEPKNPLLIKKSTILLINNELIIYKDNKTTTDTLTDIEFTTNEALLYGTKYLHKIPFYQFKYTISKPTTNYYMTKFIQQHYPKDKNGVYISNYIIPKRFNNKINPLHILKQNQYNKAPNEIIKNYSYIILTPPL